VIEGTVSGVTDEVVKAMPPNQQKQIAPYILNATLRIRRSMPAPGAVASASLEVRDPKVPKDDDKDAWTDNPTGIDSALKALFPEPLRIKAMEDAVEDVSKSTRSNTIGKLFVRIVEPISKQHG
jgi:putative ATP-dependent endonuclease of the OLD family